MNALLLKQYMELELVDMPVPEIGPEEVLVRVRACGICGSDVHGLDGKTGRRIPPLVMGHEAAGEVVATGAAVVDLTPGDRVTFDSTVYCGGCFFCTRGDVNLCDRREVLGVSPGPYRRHGAFAEYVAVPRRIMYRLPDNLSYEQAALIEAVSVAVHAVNLTPVVLGDTAVVVGSGMIGLLAMQAVRRSTLTTRGCNWRARWARTRRSTPRRAHCRRRWRMWRSSAWARRTRCRRRSRRCARAAR
jgi:L-iditol 2-dehydrogenase